MMWLKVICLRALLCHCELVIPNLGFDQANRKCCPGDMA